MISQENLLQLSRKDLQAIAKNYGVRANQTNAELIKAICEAKASESRLANNAPATPSSSKVTSDSRSGIRVSMTPTNGSKLELLDVNRSSISSSAVKTTMPHSTSKSTVKLPLDPAITDKQNGSSQNNSMSFTPAKTAAAPLCGSLNPMKSPAAVSTTTTIEVVTYEPCNSFNFGDLLYIKHGDTYCDVRITRINKKTARVMYLSNESEATVPFEDILQKVVTRQSITSDVTQDFCSTVLGGSVNASDKMHLETSESDSNSMAIASFSPETTRHCKSIVPFAANNTPKKRVSVELVLTSAYIPNPEVNMTTMLASPAPQSARKSIKRNFTEMTESTLVAPEVGIVVQPEVTSVFTSLQEKAARRLSNGLSVAPLDSNGNNKRTSLGLDHLKAPAIKIKMNKAQVARQAAIHVKNEDNIEAQKRSSSAGQLNKSSSFVYPNHAIANRNSLRTSIKPMAAELASNSIKRQRPSLDAVEHAESFKARPMPDFKLAHNKATAILSFNNEVPQQKVKTAGPTSGINSLASSQQLASAVLKPKVSNREKIIARPLTAMRHASVNKIPIKNIVQSDRNAQIKNIKKVLSNINKENNIVAKSTVNSVFAFASKPSEVLERKAVPRAPSTAPLKHPRVYAQNPPVIQKKMTIADRVASLVDNDNPFSFVNM